MMEDDSKFHYQISDLERKIENLQMALFRTKQHLNHGYAMDGYYIAHDISDPTVEQIGDANDFAETRVQAAEFEKGVWKEVLKVTGE